MSSGWVSIHRRLWDNPISKKKGWLIIWITIISMANHESNNFVWNGETITIKRGQWLTGRKVISDITKESEQTVRGALNYFESNQMIHRKVTNKFTIITVLNYSKYQNIKSNLTNKQPTTNQQLTTNNNDNKDNKEKKYIVNPKTKKEMALDEVAQTLLTQYNNSMNARFRTTKSFINNLAIWLEIYPAWEIEKAIIKMPTLEWYKTISIETLFRTRNSNGPCDYIGQILSKKEKEGGTSFNDIVQSFKNY